MSSAEAWENRLASINYYKKLWKDCHLCGKPMLKYGPHMRTAHGWSTYDEEQYELDQKAVAAEEIPEGARKRKLDLAELIEYENQQNQLRSFIISKFRSLYDCMRIVYKEIHDQTSQFLVDLPSGADDIVDGRRDIDDAIQRVLSPSFDYLDKTINDEMIRLVRLLSELFRGEYV